MTDLEHARIQRAFAPASNRIAEVLASHAVLPAEMMIPLGTVVAHNGVTYRVAVTVTMEPVA